MSELDQVSAPLEPNAGTSIPGESAAPVDPGNDTEVRAKAMGWVPKEEFRGPEEKWRSAEEFVRRGEEDLPVLRERTRDLARKYTQAEERIARQEREFSERIARQEQMAAMALRQQRETLEAQYEQAKRDAVSMGDQQRYDQLNRDQRVALNNFDSHVHETLQPKQPQPQDGGRMSPQDQATVDSWAVENPWFFADPAMRQYATVAHGHLQRTKPGLSTQENLAEVAQLVRQKFPEKFGGSGGRPAAVEGGSSTPANGGSRSKGFSDMPAVDQQIADQFIKAGAYKTRADFAKAYWSQPGM